MDHLDEGALQAYLDGELSGEARTGAAAHLLACGECRGRLDGLKDANEQLRIALTQLDVPAPPAAPRHSIGAGVRYGFGGRAFLRAAVLVLVLAAAASASVPGSPVRAWIEQVVRPAPAVNPAATPAEPVAPRAEVPAPAGVVVAATEGTEVVVTGLEGTEIRLVRTIESSLSVTAEGARRDPRFEVGAGTVAVLGGAGGVLRIEIPTSATAFRLVVDGRPHAELEAGELRVLEGGRREGDAVVWP